MRVVSFFSGIGGFDAGFAKAGLKTILMCEADPLARSVLAKHYPDTEIDKDVRKLRGLPACEVVAAGWPCQDLSQAGRTLGITGNRSNLITELFRLLKNRRQKPEYVVLENVAFALHLQKGRALSFVTDQLTDLGYNWAYRVLDSRNFGLPQRRRRLFIVASRTQRPDQILFEGFSSNLSNPTFPNRKFGFYWTEGNTGLGWSPGAIPPLKGGSGLSIPSPPAIWDTEDCTFVVPGITDAERMQGFKSNWTETDELANGKSRARWRLVGNAVSVPVSQWIGIRLLDHQKSLTVHSLPGTKQSNSGRGGPKKLTETFLIAESPPRPRKRTLETFELKDFTSLSYRAANGFLARIRRSSLRIDEKFLRDLSAYVK